MIQFPNRTAQEGVFREGTPNYVELAFGSSLPGMKRFMVRAVSDGWVNGDTLGILLKGMSGEYQVWTGRWNSDNESIECEVLEDSEGVLEDGDPVFVLAMMTRGVLELWNPTEIPVLESQESVLGGMKIAVVDSLPVERDEKTVYMVRGE